MRHFNCLDEAVKHFTNDLTSWLAAAIQKRGKASLAVSGGRTPEHLFPLLRDASLPWDRICLTLADERWVAPDHADSNEGLARRFLLQGAAREARFIGLKSDHVNPMEGQKSVELSLSKLDWPLDAIYLGMGEDGHTASLFPGGDWANGETRCVGVPETQDRQARMSLSPSALLQTRKIFLVITGAQKRMVLEEALKPGPIAELPVRLILHQDKVPLEIYVVD